MAQRAKLAATKELIEAILADLARGLTKAQACAANGITDRTLRNWEKRKEFPDLKDKADAIIIKDMLKKIEQCNNPREEGDWKRWQWLLQKRFPKQFGDDPMLLAMQQNNYYQLPEEKTKEIDARVQRLLDEKS